MSWQDILKIDTVEELTNKIVDPLDENLNSNMVMDGDYDEEKGGYYNSRGIELDFSYSSGKIRVRPSDTESDGLITDYDMYYNNLRLGSYTGEEGHYLAVEDWGEEDLDDLKQLAEDLDIYEREI